MSPERFMMPSNAVISGVATSECGSTVALRLAAEADPWPEAVPVDAIPPAHEVVTMAGGRRVTGCGWVDHTRS